MPELRGQQRPSGAVRGVERGQRDAGDRRRQRERQIHGRVDQPPAGKPVAGQHPGQHQPEDQVEGARRGRRSGTTATARRPDPLGVDLGPEPAETDAAALEEQRADRQDDDDPQHRHRHAEGEAEARQRRGMAEGRRARSAGSLRGVDLVEDAAVAEVLGLHLGPAAEVGDRDEVELGEAGDVGRIGRAGVPGAVEVLQRDRLALGAVETVEVGLGRRALLAASGCCPRPAPRSARPGSRSTARRSRTGPRRAPSSARKASFSQASSTSPMPRWAKVVVEPRAPVSSTGTCAKSVVHVVADLVLVAAELLVGPGPGREVVPARAAARSSGWA